MTRTTVQSELIATNAISGTIIADGAITSTHLAANSVDTAELVTGSIDTIHIAANNVTAAKIVSDGVETRHLHSNVISAQSAVTAASGDYVLIGDTSDSNNLKKALVSDFGESNRLPLAGGTLTGDLILGDGIRLELGAASGGDAQLFHSGSNAQFINTTGDTYIQNDNMVYITNEATSKNSAAFDTDGAVTLYHNNSAAITTASDGVSLADDKKVKLGNSTGDLELYHIGGSVSVLRSTPGLAIQSDDYISLGTYSDGELMLKATKNGSCDLYHDNAVRLSTNANGAQIGNIYFNGVSSNSQLEAGNVHFKVGAGIWMSGSSSLDLQLQVPVTGQGIVTAAKLDAPSGDWYTNDGTVSNLSDSRLKKEITTLSDGINIVKQLRPVTYKYDDTTLLEDGSKSLASASDTIRYGFVAQEVEAVASHYVTTREGKVKGETVSDLKSTSMTRMIPMLVKAIQELEAEVQALKG